MVGMVHMLLQLKYNILLFQQNTMLLIYTFRHAIREAIQNYYIEILAKVGNFSKEYAGEQG